MRPLGSICSVCRPRQQSCCTFQWTEPLFQHYRSRSKRRSILVRQRLALHSYELWVASPDSVLSYCFVIRFRHASYLKRRWPVKDCVSKPWEPQQTEPDYHLDRNTTGSLAETHLDLDRTHFWKGRLESFWRQPCRVHEKPWMCAITCLAFANFLDASLFLTISILTCQLLLGG